MAQAEIADYRPSEKEPFMNERQREYFHDKLVAWKNDILREARETLQTLQDESRNHPDLADRASSETDRAIVNALQEGFPLSPRPYAEAAEALGLTEDDLIARLKRLRETGVATRFGPFLDAAAIGGAFCLCAMAVPEARFEEVAETVNGFPEVAHNYARDHELNMWFVLATETPEGIAAAAATIEAATRLRVLRFPKLQEFFIGFRAAA